VNNCAREGYREFKDSVTWEYGRSASMDGLEIIEKEAALAS